MSDHTPGPWHSDDRVVPWQSGALPATRVAYDSSPGTSSPIAMCLTQGVGDRESIANARLIAAAPELLAFAEAYIHWVEIGATPERHLIELATAARKKAVQP